MCISDSFCGAWRAVEKEKATGNSPSAPFAYAAAAPTTARGPRWTPSKKPSATAVGRGGWISCSDCISFTPLMAPLFRIPVRLLDVYKRQSGDIAVSTMSTPASTALMIAIEARPEV